MKRLVVGFVFTLFAVSVLFGCGGGGGIPGIGTNADAAVPTIFSAGVNKEIYMDSGGTWYATTSEITSDGIFLSWVDTSGTLNNPNGPSQLGKSNVVVIPINRIQKIIQTQ